MKSYYQRQQFLTTAQMDASNKLSLQACMGLFQDIATEHCIPLGWDHASFLAKNHAFWVVTKIKLQIEQMPTVNDVVTLKTWMTEPSVVRFERDCSISLGKQRLVNAKMEWVVLDADTHRPRALKTIDYPQGLKYLPERAMESGFEQISLDVKNAQKCYRRTIYYGDTDLNHHTNNCVYSRFVLDCFDEQFWDSQRLTAYEIHFINESHAGEVLDFYRIDDGHTSLVEARVGDKVIVRAKLVFAESK
ncbi:MAG: thioesterase [Prevotella sp.]|nr:thioesterase [Prevotella sp.]